MTVELVQFKRPASRGVATYCDGVDDKYEAAYKELLGEGLRITAEVLRTGFVSLCIENPKLGDYDSELAFNGAQHGEQQAPKAKLELLLSRWNLEGYRRWKLLMLREDGL